MRRGLAWGLAALALAQIEPAVAQRSLFDATPTQEGAPPAAAAAPAPAAAAAAPRATRKKAKARPRKAKGPVPARMITVTNASPNALTGLEITQEGRTATLAKPIPSQKKGTIKLPAFKGCTVSVAATFEGQGQAETSELDICKDKSIRFTE